MEFIYNILVLKPHGSKQGVKLVDKPKIRSILKTLVYPKESIVLLIKQKNGGE